MRVEFRRSFVRDVEKLRDAVVRERVSQVIGIVSSVKTLNEIPGIKKLQTTASSYRIRIGVQAVGDEIVFARCLHRKEIYRYFP